MKSSPHLLSVLFALAGMAPSSCMLHAQVPPIRDWNSVKVELSRTGCLGTCPAYRVEIHGDGTVLYDGGLFVAITGHHRSSAPHEIVKQLLEAFQTAHYMTLRDRYTWNVTDLPTIKVRLSADGKSKEIVDYGGERAGMPKSVSALEEAIDRLSDSARWTKGDGATVDALKSEGFDFKSPEGSKILVRVARLGSAEAVRDLLSAGVVSSRTPIVTEFGDEETALGIASTRGDVEMLRALLHTNAKDSKGREEALPRAASSGELDAVRLLIRNGANPTSPEVLIGAASSRIPDVVQEILKYRPNVNARGTQNSTALIACFQANPFANSRVNLKEIVQILLEAGANPTLANDKGETPLMLNARDLQVAESLVAHGAPVNAQAKDGFTPLLNAETIELTRFLLEHGADPFAKDDNGETALDWARKMHRKDQAALLEAAMSKGRKQN